MNWQSTTGNQVAELIGAELHGDSHELVRPAAIWDADGGSLCFLVMEPSWGDDIYKRPGLVIASPEIVEVLRNENCAAIGHEAPKFAFCKAVHTLMRPPVQPGIHESAILGPDVKLGEDVSIGPFCVLQGQTELGDGVVLEAGVTLYNSVAIGSGTTIRSGARIGYDPFSFGVAADGEGYPFPAYGGVKIGSFVEIFHNVSIARGNAGDTVLSDWVRVGNNAHIGNTAEIGIGAMVCAQTDISAEVRIGRRCWIGQSAAIRQKLEIGNNTTVGMGAVVVENVPSDVTVTGVPARAWDRFGA